MPDPNLNITFAENAVRPMDETRTELRYLVGYPNQQVPVLTSWATVNNAYRVKTIYLDTPKGTWSIGKSQTKLRLRNYNGERIWWIEVKSNTNGSVEKHRRQIDLIELDSMDLVTVAMVTYRRNEFESPLQTPDFRVTIDDNLMCYSLPREGFLLSQVVHQPGVPIARMVNRVMETKGNRKVPAWLPLPKLWTGSKSRWCLAALAGTPDKIAPSITSAMIGRQALP